MSTCDANREPTEADLIQIAAENVDVENLPEMLDAAGIYEGEMPDYVPPAGWERTNISASAGYLLQEFENSETRKTFQLGAMEAANPWYVYADGGHTIAEDPIIEVMNSEKDVYSAPVRTPGPDGETLFFSLEDGFDLKALEELLSGIS